MFAKLAQIW